jgi:Fe2+ transport system protein FeoA
MPFVSSNKKTTSTILSIISEAKKKYPIAVKIEGVNYAIKKLQS